MKKNKSRRNFIKKSALIGSGLFIIPRNVLGGKGYTAPSDQLAIAAVGSGGKGTSDINNAYDKGKNRVVALCDVHPEYAKKSMDRFPDAKIYKDYRVMLENQKDIDAVTISTPDHTHAVVAHACMVRKLHVYVQKPLTHTIAEARLLRKTAKENKVVTQMGNQGGSNPGVQKVQEWIDQGKIGEIEKINAWTNRPVWPQGKNLPKSNENEKPEGLDWDLWLGPAKKRSYSPGLHPFSWRGYWDFGTGALGDMACHILDVPYKTLKLGYPNSVECTTSTTFSVMWNMDYAPEGCPLSSVVTLRYDSSPYAKNGIELVWMDGGITPNVPDLLGDDFFTKSGAGNLSMMIGNKGVITAQVYGNNPTLYQKGEAPIVFKTDKINLDQIHNTAWTEACKAGYNSKEHLALTSSFEYSGPFTETVLMGNLGLRSRMLRKKDLAGRNVYYGRKKLQWDGPNMKITNFEEANKFVTKSYHNGWKVPV